MEELTAGEIWRARELLEEQAATLLGKVLFEFGRLEMALDLCLVWVGAGRKMDQFTDEVLKLSFKEKLDRLRNAVDNSQPVGSLGHSAYLKWTGETDSIRLLRNEFVHSRWAADGARGKIVNVLGIPTSAQQREVLYEVADLEKLLEDMKRLQDQLLQLRKNWPL
ncbi:MAG TPA: hypothetical protein DCS87_03435 [Rheinheimera sp.]|nr:hypothetical protein [Rheinheimera sp.]